MQVPGKFLAIEAVQATEVGSDPEHILPIEEQAHNHVVAQAIGVARLVSELPETVVPPVVVDQPPAIRTYPQVTLPVFGKHVYIVERQTRRIAG
ncbi:hypothetical protein D3C87_1875600 [compost metagenome]